MSDTTQFCSECGAPNTPGHACAQPTMQAQPYAQAPYVTPAQPAQPASAPSYPQQYAYQPAEAYAPPPPARRGASPAMFAVVGALVGALALGGIFAFLQSNKTTEPAQAAPVAATATTSSTPSAPKPAAATTPPVKVVAPAPAVVQEVRPSAQEQAPRARGYLRGSPLSYDPGAVCATYIGSVYSHASAANNRTSCPFVRAVAERYASTGSTYLPSVKSPETGDFYNMNCSKEGSQVVCTGGVEAAVWIY